MFQLLLNFYQIQGRGGERGRDGETEKFSFFLLPKL